MESLCESIPQMLLACRLAEKNFKKFRFQEMCDLERVCIAWSFQIQSGKSRPLRQMRVRVAGLGRNRLEPADCRLRLYLLLLFFVVCRLSLNSRELEYARKSGFGPWIGNDVHQLLLKYEPSWPHGGAVIKAQR